MGADGVEAGAGWSLRILLSDMGGRVKKGEFGRCGTGCRVRVVSWVREERFVEVNEGREKGRRDVDGRASDGEGPEGAVDAESS